MVRVPQYEQSVQLRPELRQDLAANATPQAFGSDVGAGMEGLAKGGQSLARDFAEVQHFDDTQRAKDADNNYAGWLRNRMYGDGGFMTLEGRNAVDSRTDFEREVEQKRKEFGQKLTPGAQLSYQEASTARAKSAFQQSIVHSAQARKQWFNDTSKARVESFADDALVNFDKPGQVMKNLGAGLMEIREVSRMHGWDDAVRGEREKDFVSGVHKNIALKLAQSDPLAAEKYINEKSDFISGADRFALDNSLKVPMKEAHAQRAASDFFAGRTTAAPTDLFMADPSPAGLVERGNIDLTKRPRVQNGKEISTVRSASFNFGDGKETLIPTVSDDGKLLSNDEAVALYRKTGKHLGKFETPKQADAYGKTLHQQQERMYVSGAEGSAPGLNQSPAASANMIRRFEGFKTSTYWDVNHFRTGYGSDTITRDDGSVVEVKPGMSVTRADAERDLQRRIGQTQGKIIASVGQDRWGGLSAPARAAVTSVAYNYGSLPSSVSDAIRTGGPAEIATAIRGLGGANGGVNRSRRNQEADAVLGVDVGAAGRSAQSYFTDMEGYLDTIKDPDVRELTRRRINASLETHNKAEQAATRQAKAQLWNYVDQGYTPDQVPMEVRQAAGMDAVSSAWNYFSTASKGRDVQDDDTLVYQMRRFAASNPDEFAQIDLNDVRDKVSKSTLKELTTLQTGALTDQRKARLEGFNITEAFSQATTQLKAVGITTDDKKGSQLEAANLRIARFNNALAAQMDEFKRGNDNRAPTQPEIQSMINRLLLPVVIKTPGSWFGGTDAFQFEARMRPDDAVVTPATKYEDVPIDVRRGIAVDLERELGRKPSEAEVVKRYLDVAANH